MTIFVGSTNPVKINAVRLAAEWKWPDVRVEGFEVESGVSVQPMTDVETKTGAENRAKAALAAGLAKGRKKSKTYLGVGLEGGILIDENHDMWSTVWGVVIDIQGKTYPANGARVKVPKIIADPIIKGEEMGPVMQQLTGLKDVRKAQGMFGVITKEFVTRTEEYGTIAKMALGMWFGRDWQDQLTK